MEFERNTRVRFCETVMNTGGINICQLAVLHCSPQWSCTPVSGQRPLRRGCGIMSPGSCHPRGAPCGQGCPWSTCQTLAWLCVPCQHGRCQSQWNPKVPAWGVSRWNYQDILIRQRGRCYWYVYADCFRRDAKACLGLLGAHWHRE